MIFLNVGNIAPNFDAAVAAYTKSVAYALEAGRSSYARAEVSVGNIRHKGNQFQIASSIVDEAQATLLARFQVQSSLEEHVAGDADASAEDVFTQMCADDAHSSTVSERLTVHGNTKTDVRRDYAGVPCLVSYPRSGNHYIRFMIEFITGRPTAGCPSGQAVQPNLKSQKLDWPIATVDFRQVRSQFAMLPMPSFSFFRADNNIIKRCCSKQTTSPTSTSPNHTWLPNFMRQLDYGHHISDQSAPSREPQAPALTVRKCCFLSATLENVFHGTCQILKLWNSRFVQQALLGSLIPRSCRC